MDATRRDASFRREGNNCLQSSISSDVALVFTNVISSCRTPSRPSVRSAGEGAKLME